MGKNKNENENKNESGAETLLERIRRLQGDDKTAPRYMIGEQLLDIARHESDSAELIFKDLEVKEMSLTAAAAKLKEYADKHHGKSQCFCITPDVADGILREFYGLKPRAAVAALSDDIKGAAGGSGDMAAGGSGDGAVGDFGGEVVEAPVENASAHDRRGGYIDLSDFF